MAGNVGTMAGDVEKMAGMADKAYDRYKSGGQEGGLRDSMSKMKSAAKDFIGKE